ncbi:MAG: hypothetical protein N4A33_02540 [Bacteriovoracaceae bacterium]|jgi:glutathione peroxidase|nr:hypothetical protein [Bacteriovoracaceae bacterium]
MKIILTLLSLNLFAINLHKFDKKVFFITNIATKCGYTHQLKDIEKLKETISSKNFKIIAIPSNDFGMQNPENTKKTQDFCELNYKTTFQVFPKSIVKGEQAISLIKNLIKQDDNKEIKWNFEKFIVSKNGKLLGRFSSATSPLDQKIISLIKAQL